MRMDRHDEIFLNAANVPEVRYFASSWVSSNFWLYNDVYSLTLFPYGRSKTFGASYCPICYSHAYNEEGGSSSLRNVGDRTQEYTVSQLLEI